MADQNEKGRPHRGKTRYPAIITVPWRWGVVLVMPSVRLMVGVYPSRAPHLAILLLFLLVLGCSEIKPMTLPAYYPPDLSSIKRPPLPTPVEGKDYTIDAEKNTVTYTISGQDLLAAEALSEQAGWVQVEMLKQIIGTQSELIKQDRELITIVDLKRQYAERQKIYGDIEKYVSWVISLIMMGLFIAK